MTDQSLPAGAAAGAPSVVSAPVPGAETASPPHRRLGVGAIVAIAAGSALTLALVFGGGFATAWALGASSSSSIEGGDGSGQPPQLGEGGAPSDGTLPGPRPEDDESAWSTDDSRT